MKNIMIILILFTFNCCTLLRQDTLQLRVQEVNLHNMEVEESKMVYEIKNDSILYVIFEDEKTKQSYNLKNKKINTIRGGIEYTVT